VNEELHKKLHNKAVILISRRAYSRGEMRLKLLKSADRSTVEVVLDRLEQLKLLNDVDYAYNFALYRTGREGWGPGKIQNALIRRHVHPSCISKALDRVLNEIGEDYGLLDYLDRYCAKRALPNDPKGIHNLINHLLRRGYRRSRILEALNKILPSKTMKYFGTGD